MVLSVNDHSAPYDGHLAISAARFRGAHHLSVEPNVRPCQNHPHAMHRAPHKTVENDEQTTCTCNVILMSQSWTEIGGAVVGGHVRRSPPLTTRRHFKRHLLNISPSTFSSSPRFTHFTHLSKLSQLTRTTTMAAFAKATFDAAGYLASRPYVHPHQRLHPTH